MSAKVLRLLGLAVCLFAVVRVGMADPPFDSGGGGKDNCDQRCIIAAYFIDSPGLTCSKYDPGICHLCVAGRCKDPGPTQPDCNAQTPDRTNLYVYAKGSCSPVCTLPLNGTSQATQPTGDPTDGPTAVTWTKCEN